MTDQELEKRLAKAISRAAPNDPEGVLSRCEMRKGNVIPMTTRRKNPWARNLIAACLALALVGGVSVVYQQAYAVTSVVSLDVNPSIELEVNKNEKVLRCEGLNEQAKEVLAGMNSGADLKGTKLDVAVNAIVGALVRSGYLDSVSSTILISVEDADQNRAAKLQQELTAAVDGVLQAQASGAAVLSQTVEKNAAVEKQAKENNISTGKAALISQVMALNGSLTFDGLSALSVEELKDLAETGAPGMPIGRDEAVRKAVTYAGVGHLSSVRWETDSELADRTPHYEVELYTSAGEFEYDVDAYTGEVLRGKADVLAEEQVDAPPAGNTGARIGETEAFNIAAADFYARNPELKGSNIFNNRAELDEDDGALHYDVEFLLGGYEVDYEVDADTGEILKWDSDYEGPATRPEEPSGTVSGEAQTDIGRDAAKAAALAHAGVTETQVTGMRVEKDEDDGRMEYEVDFKSGGMEYEYTIDASTGAVLEHEKDQDD